MSVEKDLPLFSGEPRTEIVGHVERVVFHNSENGFTVLRLVPDAPPPGKAASGAGSAPCDPVMCVGHMVDPKTGLHIKVGGQFVINPRFGKQLSFDFAEEVLPATLDGIRLYLSSGLIKGVGSDMAARIVDKFGLDTIRVLDEEPRRLLTVRGIGRKNLERICNAWNEHRGIRELMLFLQPQGISAAYAIRIHKAYGQHAMQVVRENPYRLAMDIHGIGFLTADTIAAKLGFSNDHPLRLQAAALHLLQKSCDEGHVYLPQDVLEEKICKLVEASPDQASRAITELEQSQRIVIDTFPAVKDDKSSHNGVYLGRLYNGESKIAFYLKRIANSPKSVRFNNNRILVERCIKSLPMELAPAQIEAVNASTRSKILVITGGPGTGKTTIIKAIIKIFEAAKAKIALAAPTGRAAKRMSEATERDAKTIHRLLEYSPKEDCFARNEDNPLSCGLLVIDESSMMDTMLFYYLLKAVPLGATVLLVGDVHQLPSVGPGNVLGDIIESGRVPVVELNEIFRQSAQSEIICNAHLINNGKMPLVEKNPGKLSDFYFIPRDNPDEAADLIVDLVKNHIPRRFGFDPVRDIQLLTPMHKGAVGAERMNSRLQDALNPNALEARRGERIYRLHDKVMQLRNNYDKDIFNGDMGRIVYLDPHEKTLSVDFDGIIMPYSFDELDELVPAYAISIHKSQGSEYPAVVIPLMMQHYMLLQRNLIYTGVTRGKRLVVLVGEYKALQIAIRNNATGTRNTRLAQRLLE